MDGTAEKIIQRAQKINASTKSLVERLCDLKIYALSVLCCIGSISAPNEGTKDEAHALQCTTAGPYNAIPTGLLCVGSVCGLGPDLLGIHTLSLAARYTTAANSNTLTKGLEKIQAARGYDPAPIFALNSDWEEKFLNPSMARSTVEAFDMVCCLEHSGKLDESPQNKNKRQPQPCFATNYMSRTLPGRSLFVPPEFLDQSVAFALRRSCLT